MFTEEMFNVELIEVECDHVRIEQPEEEQVECLDSELMDLVGDDNIGENHENTNNAHNEADVTDCNMSNEATASPESSIVCVTNETDCNANSTNEAVDDVNTHELRLRGIARMEFKIENHHMYNGDYVASPPFMCRKLPFHLLLQKRMINNNEEKIAIFLKRGTPNGYVMPLENRYPDESYLLLMASATIGIINHTSGVYTQKSFESHLFRHDTDYGFSDFMPMKDIGVDDSVSIFVTITASPPFCYSNNSKQITGYVGIRNQGATCYMNSLLEVLFFLTKFRTACYRIPTEMDHYSSMALALQKVFYNLQFSNVPVSTINLTKSFGWTTVDALMQHDIQELMRVLIERIESRMTNTLLQDIVPSMFQGAFISYVKCRDVEFTSERLEIFYDIQLSLEKAKTVYEAFEAYVSPEIMDNENKYDAGSLGLQTAEKGTKFTKFPPVLFLHLLRFQFDGTLNMAVKNNNSFEFYDHIDLSKFVSSDESKPSKYSLFAVLSHSGGGQNGHYVAYINPELDGNWLKFNDEIISFVQPFDAINENYGSDGNDEWAKSQKDNAYMLVYIRDSDAKEILEPTDPRYISNELIISSKTDGMYDDNEWSSNATADIYVFLDTLLESEIRFEDTKYVRRQAICSMPMFIVQNDISPNKFKSIIKDAFKISNDNQFRIWPIYHCSPSYQSHPFFLNNDDTYVPMLSEFRDKHRYGTTVWVEIALPGSELPSFDPNKDVLIFYYVYCSSQSRTYYINHGYHDRMLRVAELVPTLNRMMEWPLNQELNIYEELAGSKIRELNMSDSLMNGINSRRDTFVMNIVFEAKEHEMSMTALPTINMFYEDVRNHVKILFWNTDDKDIDFSFFVSMNKTFPQLMDMLARKLNYERAKIQVFRSYSGRYQGDPIPSTCTETLSTLLNCSRSNEPLLYYKLFEVNVIDVENKIPFHFQWLSIDMKKTKDFTLYITNDQTLQNILDEAKTLLQPEINEGSGTFRLLRVKENNIVKVLNETKQLFKYLTSKKNRNYFRIEEIPKGDYNNDFSLNEMNVVVFHHSIGNKVKRFLGHSFIFKIKLNEQWQDIKERLRLRLKLSEGMWKNYQPIIFESEDPDEELAMKDMECIDDIDPNTVKKYVIRLDHKHRTASEEANQSKFMEKSILIND